MAHNPVMVSEVIEYLLWDYSGVYVDCTVGDGMHTKAILEKIAPYGGKVIGMDRDPRAINIAKSILENYGDNLELKLSRFSDLELRLLEYKWARFSGFFFDLGLNTSRLEEAESGFSYKVDGPLDMRMSPKDTLTAAEIVNRWDEKRLADMFYFNSDEHYSRRIARAIVRYRNKSEIKTTFQLKEIIYKVVKPPYQLKSVARCFQALRIVVNGEMEELKAGLSAAHKYMIDNSRLVVIAYNSSEDRIVKNFIRQYKYNTNKSKFGRYFRVLTPKPIIPSKEEKYRNRASRSAKLRAAELVEVADA